MADITIAGTIPYQGAYDVEARWNGGAWTDIDTGAVGSFSGTLSAQAEGQGTLEVRVKDYPAQIASAAHVGVGDVFVIAGQSNASGRGTNNQSYSHATLKAGLLGNDYVWGEMIDPTDDNTGQVDGVSSDSIAAGSVWPLIATSIMADQGVPVAFIPCAKGGAGIASWQPGVNHSDRTTLYGSMNYRITQCGGALAVLWWGGETDALASMAEATFNSSLDSFADAVNVDQSIPTIVCKLQNSSGIPDVDEAAINSAINTAWGDNTNVVQGPDLSDMASDDSFHLQSDAKLAEAAARWWAAIQAALYP